MALKTRTSIEDAIRDWLGEVWSASSVTVIFANQGTPLPATPCATVLLAGPLTWGHDSRLAITDPGAPSYASQDVHGDRSLSASINVYGSGAFDFARAAVNSLALETIRDGLRSDGLATPAVNPEVRELTSLQITDPEERAQFDVVFAFGEVTTDSIPLIERVSGTGTIESPEDVPRGTVDFDTGS